MSDQKFIKLLVRPQRLLYPKNTTFKARVPASWAIIKFTVLEVREQEDEDCFITPFSVITGKGCFPAIDDKDDYVIIGSFEEDEKYGAFFNVHMTRLDYNLESFEDQKVFLEKSGLTTSMITKLYETIHDPIEALKNEDYESLLKVKGIGMSTATRMINRYKNNIDYSIAYVELEDLGLTTKAIQKLVNFYHSPEAAIAKIKENPYILIEEVRGYGWEKADAIALAGGIPLDSPFRVRAYMYHYLQSKAEDEGHSWVSVAELFTQTAAKCQVSLDMLKEVAASMRDGENPVLYHENDTQRIGLLEYRTIEEKLAQELIRLQQCEPKLPVYPGYAMNTIKAVESELGFTYGKDQVEAILNAVNNQVSVLTGLAGTGKTYSVKAVVAILQGLGYRVAQCSLSGRAASKLTEVTGIEGQTIHRLLKYSVENGEDPNAVGVFVHNKDYPLPYDIIIGDEVSMWGGEITLSLLEAVADGTKLLLVGDPGQLEAIGLANVLNDVIASGVIPVAKLTQIHRQKNESGIISESLKVAHGTQLLTGATQPEEYRGVRKDLKIISYSGTEYTLPKILEEFKNLYYNQHVPANDIQVIVPMRIRGSASCRVLNNEIQNIVNKESFGRTVTVEYHEKDANYSYTYKVGDRIIITKNMYHTIDINGGEYPVFNGNCGTITDIDEENMYVKLINIGNEPEICLQQEEYNNIALGYAITVHKKQGDSSPYIIFGIDNASYKMLCREMVYTGITRARKYCALICDRKALSTAIAKTDVKTKQTWLQELLKSEENKKYKI